MVSARSLTLIACALLTTAAAVHAAETVPVRQFRFIYDAQITGLPPGGAVRFWFPVAKDAFGQRIEIVKRSGAAAAAQIADEPIRGNRIGYCEATADAAGHISLGVTYNVTRQAMGAQRAETTPAPADDRDLRADVLVPIGGKPATLLDQRALPRDPLALGRALYDLVDEHMTYRKDEPGWGRGDAAWACDSRFGNCTDFHSLFLSLARTRGLPARFEIGFALPETRGAGPVPGYHCWAFFRAGDAWTPVDISEASKHPAKRDYFFGHLDENRVTFSTGRDVTLVPPQAGPPLNFFVYPYAEVAGSTVPAAQVKTTCTFEDAAPPAATQP